MNRNVRISTILKVHTTLRKVVEVFCGSRPAHSLQYFQKSPSFCFVAVKERKKKSARTQSLTNELRIMKTTARVDDFKSKMHDVQIINN
jgi:hypothetical protein